MASFIRIDPLYHVMCYLVTENLLRWVTFHIRLSNLLDSLLHDVLANISNKETFLQYFLIILRPSFQNY